MSPNWATKLVRLGRAGRGDDGCHQLWDGKGSRDPGTPHCIVFQKECGSLQNKIDFGGVDRVKPLLVLTVLSKAARGEVLALTPNQGRQTTRWAVECSGVQWSGVYLRTVGKYQDPR